MTVRQIKRVMIANRGEIALRILRTAKELSLDVVVVFEGPDSDAYYIRLAEEAIQSFHDLGFAGRLVDALDREGPLPVSADKEAAYQCIHNLIDNSIRHGKKVTRIRIACELSGDMLVMVYEDDGVGIPESEKQLLFAKGHGKNGGMGLFLAREVLATTSISITENGTPGRGARFVMTIPAEAWRRPAADVPTVSETV